MQRFAFIILLFSIGSCETKEEKKQETKPDNWVIYEKKRFEHKLNAVGSVDTTFVYTYSYKDGMLADSSISFSVFKYKGKFLSDEINFNVSKDNKIIQGPTRHSEFSPTGRLLSTSVINGNIVIRSERYGYNDSNLLSKYTVITKASSPQSADDPKLASTNESTQIRYDTVIGTYEYDNTKKVTGVSYTDQHGNIVRADANIYSGNDPLASVSTDSKGDTLQKISYKKEGRILQTIIENDSFVLAKNLINGVQVAQLTIYKNKKEKWRSATNYDSKGRVVEELLYKGM